MDLKSKRIFEITQMIICFAMLLLYTRIGSIGSVYVAITLEIVFGLVLLFLGSATTSKLYCIISTILIEGFLLLFNYLFIIPAEIMFVGTFIKFFMFLIPFYAVLQWIKGILQKVLEPQISAVTDLLFWIATILGSILASLILGKYGIKAADLMQSVKLEHFYVILSLIPGFIFGFMVAFVFLFYIAHMHKKEVIACMRQVSLNKQNIFVGLFIDFKEQFQNQYLILLQKIPVWLLLILSLKEIKAENYLFGHLYGAVLPLFGLVWHFFSIAFIIYKKRLFVLHKKRIFEQYYHEVSTVLSFTFIYSVYFMVCTFALHKSYLAIWSLQTSSSFMGLMKASSVIACIGFIYKMMIDIMLERNLKRECNISMISGVILSAVVSAICNKFLGAGNALYILSIMFGILVSVLMSGWFLGNEIGINYLNILRKTYKALVLNVFICLIMVIVENLIFTALGGFGTLVICLVLSYILLRIGIFALRIFSKEERQMLAFKSNIKVILGISRQTV